MKKVEKGGYGYFSWEKKRRAAATLIMFLLPVAFSVTGYIQTGTRKNLFTLVAVLGSLPACKALVGWLVMLPRKSMGRECYESILGHAGDLPMVYDLYFTTYERNIQVDAMAVCCDEVVGYCRHRQEHWGSMEGYIQDTIRDNGYPVTVQLMEDLPMFLERLDAMVHAAGREHEGQQIRQILLAVTL